MRRPLVSHAADDSAEVNLFYAGLVTLAGFGAVLVVALVGAAVEVDWLDRGAYALAGLPAVGCLWLWLWVYGPLRGTGPVLQANRTQAGAEAKAKALSALAVAPLAAAAIWVAL